MMHTESRHVAYAIATVHLPRYCSEKHRFVHDVDPSDLSAWQEDGRTRAIFLDTMIVCPLCLSLPTVRCGCAHCGSALYTQQTLIHHYACAHVASRTQFQHHGGTHCPKCGMRDPVQGADFEFITGEYECLDCLQKFDSPELIGHCLSCQHRFPIREAHQQSLFAWEVLEPVTAIRRTGTFAFNAD